MQPNVENHIFKIEDVSWSNWNRKEKVRVFFVTNKFSSDFL